MDTHSGALLDLPRHDEVHTFANDGAAVRLERHATANAHAALEPGRNGKPTATRARGRIVTIHGSVINVEFPRALPGLHEALLVTNGGQTLVLEVEQILGPEMIRAIALGNTDGLARGLSVESTARSIRVPVGTANLGRVFNV